MKIRSVGAELFQAEILTNGQTEKHNDAESCSSLHSKHT